MSKLSKKLIPLLFAMLLMAGLSVAVFAEGETQKKDFSQCMVEMPVTAYVYTGSPIEPQVTFKDNYTTLIRGTHYDLVSLANNVNVGTATAVYEGKGDYAGQKTVTYTISRGKQENVVVESGGQNLVFRSQLTGAVLKIKHKKSAQLNVSGAMGNVTYTSLNPTFFSVSPQGLITVKKTGDVMIRVQADGIVNGIQNYEPFIIDIPFRIVGEEFTKSNTRVTLSKTTYTYNGDTKKPAVKKVTYKGKKLKKNKDYKVKYVNNVNAGTAKVVVTGIGKYSNKREIKFTIKRADNPMQVRIDDSTILPKEKAYITVKKAKGEVFYKSSDSRIASVSDSGVVTGKEDGTVTITVTSDGGVNYKKVVKKIKVTVGNFDLTDKNCKVSLSRTSYTYDGNEKTPTVTIKYNGTKLKKDRDYSVRYDDNKNAGVASVILKGRGRYQGTRVVTFRINKADQHFTLTLPSGYIPVGGTTRARINGPAIGRVTFGSRSPNYARPINSSSSTFKGYKPTQDGITIYARAAGDENHNPYTAERFVPVKEE